MVEEGGGRWAFPFLYDQINLTGARKKGGGLKFPICCLEEPSCTELFVFHRAAAELSIAEKVVPKHNSNDLFVLACTVPITS